MRLTLPAAVLAGIALLTLSACGATGENSTTIDAFNLQRGVVVGAKGDVPPGTRALSGRVTKRLADLEGEVNDTLFGDGGEVKRTGYLNGILPTAGARERVYQGDRAAWLVRDVADTAATPTAVVGMFPAPFTTRFTGKRRLMPTRVQCIESEGSACTAASKALADAGIQSGLSAATDSSTTNALRLYVGPWKVLRPTLARGRLRTGLAIEQDAQRNPYGFSIAAEGDQITTAVPFGESAQPQQFGVGTGVVFAFRDTLGSAVWIVTGTDEAGTLQAAKALKESTLAGRVAAVISPQR